MEIKVNNKKFLTTRYDGIKLKLSNLSKNTNSKEILFIVG